LKSRNDTTHDAVRAQGEAAVTKQKRLQRPNKINYQAFMAGPIMIAGDSEMRRLEATNSSVKS